VPAAAALPLGLGLILAPSGPARAVPIDDPHVGGIGFSGPTNGDLAAVYWNPAALGLMRGLHLMVTGTADAATTTVARQAPGGEGRAYDRNHPFVWPFGPGAFGGISYDVGGDRFTLAFATYMPYVERQRYDLTPAGAGAGGTTTTRYHRIAADLRNFALVPALAVRFAGDFRLGFAPGFLFSTGRLTFDEPICSTGSANCPEAEDTNLDARYDLGSGLGLGSSRFAVTLGAGLYFRRRAWEFGLSFSSRPIASDVDQGVVIAGERTTVTGPGGTPLVRPGMEGMPCGTDCVYADIVYKLPYTVTGAVSWHPRPGTELQGIVRVLSFPSNDVVDIRLTGAALIGSGLPEHVVLHRGYGTVVDTRFRVTTWAGERFRLGAALRLESAGLPAEAVSPAAVDGVKLQPMGMFMGSPVRHLWIGAGYGFTYMLPVTASTSVYMPAAARECALSGGNLGNDTGDPSGEACRIRLDGRARPGAAGTYRRHIHSLSVSVMAQF
jgi:hypothetical protein